MNTTQPMAAKMRRRNRRKKKRPQPRIVDGDGRWVGQVKMFNDKVIEVRRLGDYVCMERVLNGGSTDFGNHGARLIPSVDVNSYRKKSVGSDEVQLWADE